MISYKYNKDKEIVETIITGTVKIKDLTEYIITLGKDKNLPETLKILTDARNAEFYPETQPEDLAEIVKANYKSLVARNYVYDAFTVSTPTETAMGKLYEEFSKAENYKFKIFSTMEAAEKWLNKF